MGETELAVLLRGMRARLHPERYGFACVVGALPSVPGEVVRAVEDEGTTLVAPVDALAAAGLAPEFPCARITLDVASSLDAVGFLAAVTTALAAQGIGVNPVAAFHHDHLFVPWDARDRALAALEHLAAEGISRPTGGSPATGPSGPAARGSRR